MVKRPEELGLGVLSAVSEIDLKVLAEVRGEEDTFLSIYFSSTNDDHRQIMNSRLKIIERALPYDLKKTFLRTLSLITDSLLFPHIKGERGRVFFACSQTDFFRAYSLNLELEPLIVLSNAPFLLPLARLRDDYVNYGLLLIDSQNAKLFVVRSDIIEEKAKVSIDLMNKHKKGGWSQMRFERLRKGSIKSFFSQITEDLKLLDDQEVRGIVIAGPGKAKFQFVEALPISLKDELLDMIDTSMYISPKNLIAKGDKLALESEIAEGKRKALAFRDAILKGLPAAYGLAEVNRALEEGRVTLLLVLKKFNLPGLICIKCNEIHQNEENCPTCGQELAALRLERLLELAQNSNAEIEFVEEDEFLKNIGGVGAILRY
jgi:peptide chain release factor subunit 1